MSYQKLSNEWREFFTDVATERVKYHHTATHPGHAKIGAGNGYTLEKYDGYKGRGWRVHLYNPVTPGYHKVEYYLEPRRE